MRSREAAMGEVDLEFSLKDEWDFKRMHSNMPCRGHSPGKCMETWENRVRTAGTADHRAQIRGEQRTTCNMASLCPTPLTEQVTEPDNLQKESIESQSVTQLGSIITHSHIIAWHSKSTAHCSDH